MLARRKKELRLRRYDSLQEEVGAFHRYQITLLLVTQLANSTITGSMLCTIYDMATPKLVSCLDVEDFNTTKLCDCTNATFGVDFHSLLVELKLYCSNDYIPTLMTSSVMTGGVFGATIFGYFADSHGRKLLCIVALVGCCVSNFVLCVASYHWIAVLVAFFVLGLFGGGYMVVNSVLLMESVGGSRWRLLCACLTGWPFGMMCMSLIGFATKHWLWYHLSLAGIAFVFTVAFYLFVHESPRWLLTKRKIKEAEIILGKIAKMNRRKLVTLEVRSNESDKSLMNGKVSITSETSDNYELKIYSYLDLVRNKFIIKRLAPLTYCWLAASVVSFGLYFNLGAAEGNLYLNTFLTGLLKGTTGFLPYVLDHCMGRKPILVVSVIVTCCSCWAAAIFYLWYYGSDELNWMVTVFTIIGTASIDPMWKINHLYSTELFPTVVRNMARAVCNVGSRLGSLIGPQVAYLSQIYYPSPYIVYGSVALIHLVVAAFCLPETKGKPLIDRIPTKNDKVAQQLRVL